MRISESNSHKGGGEEMCEEKNVSRYFDIKKKNVIASMTVSYLLAKMQTATPKEAVRLSVELRKWHRKKVSRR